MSNILNFPESPEIDQIFLAQNGKIYKYTGKWSIIEIEQKTAFNKNFGNESDTVCEGNDIRLNTTISHNHGNIEFNGTFNNLTSFIGNPVIIGNNGELIAGQFGTQSGQFCEGNDVRLSESGTSSDSMIMAIIFG
jgi:hypothetical protein